jgi:hypothetical protein
MVTVGSGDLAGWPSVRRERRFQDLDGLRRVAVQPATGTRKGRSYATHLRGGGPDSISGIEEVSVSILSFRTNVVVPSSCDLYSVVAQMSSLLKSFCSPYVNSGNIPVVVFRLCLRTSAVSSVCVLFVRVLPRFLCQQN